MRTIKKQYLFGFLLIFLVGVGLLIGGVFRYLSQGKSDFVETDGYVVSVETRVGEDGMEYRPFAVRYFVEAENKYYETSVFSWFSHPIHAGDTMNVWYDLDNPTHTVVSNTNKEMISYVLIGVGGVLVVAGIILTIKYLYDVKRG